MVITLDCPNCDNFLGRPHELYEHLRKTHEVIPDKASNLVEQTLEEWKLEQMKELKVEKPLTQKQKELEEYEKNYLARQGIQVDDEAGKELKGAKWVGKNVNLLKLTRKIEDWFREDGYPEVRNDVSSDKMTYTVQARKGGVLRTLSSSRKVLTITIHGEPNNFQISVGTGEWGKGIAVAVVLTGIIGVAGLGLNAMYREKVWKNIKQIVNTLENSTINSSINGSIDDSKNNSDGTSQFCTECGNTLIHNAKFCGSCGTKITS